MVLLWVATPRVHAAQGTGGIGASQPAVALLFFPTLNLTASVMDETRWTAEARVAGGGQAVDFVTGQRDGGSFAFAVFQVDGATCPSLMNRELARSGTRRAASPLYAPEPLDAAIVEREDGLATFCKTVRGRATVFSLDPGAMTREQQLSLRLLAISMGITAVPGRVQGAGGGTSAPADRVRDLLPGRVRLDELQLMVPVLANSSWRAGIHVAPSGARLDQLSVIGSDGHRLVVSVSRIDQAGTACPAALDAFRESSTIVPAPRWVPPDWHQQAAVSSNGSIACLPLARSLLLVSVTPVAARDTSVVGLMLMGVRFAAIDTWGAP